MAGLSNEQLIGIVVAVIAIILVLTLVKKVVKFIITAVIVVCALVYFGIMTPEQLKDISTAVAENEALKTQISNLSKATENIKVSTSGGFAVKLKINDDWVSISDIESVITVKDSLCKVKIEGKEYKVTDSSVIQLLDLLVK